MVIRNGGAGGLASGDCAAVRLIMVFRCLRRENRQMCYADQIVEDYRTYVRMFGADMSIRDLAQLYVERVEGSGAKIPKAMDGAFANPNTEDEGR
jgi:hypothetical protein